jgi:tetratricopeptide (TPR) repeat protein
MERKKRRNLRLLELEAQERPDDYYVRFQLGTTEVALGRHERALAHFLDAERTMPPHAPIEIRLWTQLRLAQASFVLGRLGDAEAHARAALGLSPDLELANYLLAAVWSGRGRPHRALVCLRRILDRSEPDAIAPMRRDVVESDARRLREALERVRAVA